MIKEETKKFDKRQRAMRKYIAEGVSQSLESVLSTRLPHEIFRGFINIYKMIFVDTPIDEIQQALVRRKRCNTHTFITQK